MSRHTYTAFQRHLLFFSTPTQPPRLTILSALRASCTLGLDLPIALLLSVSLRILYTPFPYFWHPIVIDDIPRSSHRTQLSSAVLPPSKSSFTCAELLALLGDGKRKGWVQHKIDQGHVIGFWSMAAGAGTNVVRRRDLEAFREGEWEGGIAERRRGRGDVVPLWRGGPVWVAGHSWAVGRLLGVRVYEGKAE
ncbi:hypothetical protein T440DRAFT_552151 [Plenodomus tracheiphilus IPT5]|uniref:Uncharacterized protein n=1 Tax=Plenodomus tracheiphilus IPT5 TaxID=1408161 RepID=A0A6A7BFT3_9PLEO|nr:hypothetical protein T440DRAFT_552151 [Plenodomus tracheiphilus IPT5]